ncbi:Nif3-like dinuclear metal center hexameric protein [Cellulomonas sp. KH9]|uniref:Nif3-like dinuclear metal center hexameric protein n=1 Tax=Cellulomonas sp. KH9 TaxID=1855324 RepID=UPI0008F19B83|nr:Nif3-like dinuclear metal center hexameric protein [Cellulomonas sp. KH9]SFK03654.1 dinuclear metal center protein, YbgI/SA1388 family [Cellulomonas sp. KH9]
MTATLADVVAALDRRYPPGTAEQWDRVGLAAGDPDAPVRRVLLAVDPVAAVVDEALAWEADLLVTHHPLLLRPVHSVAATTFKGALLHRLVRGGCGLYTAHTNADAAHGGVAEALADTIGLVGTEPLVPADAPALDKHVVMVPVEDAERLVDALAGAGAGHVGAYERCAWTTTGEGTFTPLPGAAPALGVVGRRETVAEARVEMVAPRSRRAAVVAAMRSAHPYEEPAFDVLELAALPGATGLGRVGTLPAPQPLHAFAAAVARAVPATAQGVRYAGDPDMPVRRVAVLGGSGDSLFDAVRAADVDVYVTADLRHHPASEQQERAAFDARGGAPRPALVDLAHSASEWLWLPRAAQALRDDLAAAGTTVETRVSTRRTDPWTGHVPQTSPPEGTT